MEEEFRNEKLKASNFRAQPCDVIHKEPFIPAKSDKPITGMLIVLVMGDSNVLSIVICCFRIS